MRKILILLGIIAVAGAPSLYSADDGASSAEAAVSSSADNAAKGGKKGKGSFSKLFADMDVQTRIQLMKQFDKDGDGRLNKEERAAAEEAMKSKSADLEAIKEKHAAEVIKKFDKDGDDKLNQAEMCAFLDEQRKMFEEDREKMGRRRGNFKPPKEILEKYDTNGDGKIDKEERKAIRVDMQKRRQAFIGKYDKDGDGRLSGDEAKAASQDEEVQNMVTRMFGNNNPPPPND